MRSIELKAFVEGLAEAGVDLLESLSVVTRRVSASELKTRVSLTMRVRDYLDTITFEMEDAASSADSYYRVGQVMGEYLMATFESSMVHVAQVSHLELMQDCGAINVQESWEPVFNTYYVR